MRQQLLVITQLHSSITLFIHPELYSFIHYNSKLSQIQMQPNHALTGFPNKVDHPTTQNSQLSTSKQTLFSKGYYAIESKSSKRVFDVCQDANRKGELIIYDHYAGANQQFQIVHHGGLVTFKCKYSAKVLTVSTNSDVNGAAIIEQPDCNTENQKFRLQEISPNSNEYFIYTFCGKVIDCCEQATSNGTAVIQWSFHGKLNQIWKIFGVSEL